MLRKHVVEGWFDRLAKKDRGGDAVAILRAVADADGRRSARTLAYLLAEQGNIEELRARADAVEYERRGQYLEDIHLTRYDPARPGQWPALRFLP